MAVTLSKTHTKPGRSTFLHLYIKQHPLFDSMPHVVSPMPKPLQSITVESWARLICRLHKWTHGKVRVPLNEDVVGACDDMTPRWRRYHTAYEMSAWFHEHGFAARILTHRATRMVSASWRWKSRRMRFREPIGGNAPKLWDEDKTMIGQDFGCIGGVSVTSLRSYRGGETCLSDPASRALSERDRP